MCPSSWPAICCQAPPPMARFRRPLQRRRRLLRRPRPRRRPSRRPRPKGRRWPMKLEQISLRTGFLLALAGWAAAVWLATVFGLGSQLPGADGDADAAPSLPSLPPLAAERMASADSYSAIGERPLFAEDRRPRPICWGQRTGGQCRVAPDRRAADRRFRHGHLHHRTEPLAAPASQRRSRGWLAAGRAAAAPGDGDRPRWQPGPGTGRVQQPGR